MPQAKETSDCLDWVSVIYRNMGTYHMWIPLTVRFEFKLFGVEIVPPMRINWASAIAAYGGVFLRKGDSGK